MQTRFFSQLCLAVTAMVILASCGSKTNTQGKLIPKDAAIVVHLNGESLNAKLPWDEIKTNPLFQQVSADSTTPPVIKKTLNDPDNSGIDIKKDLVFFMLQDSSGSYIGIEGSIKDAAKFKAFNIEASGGGSEAQDGDQSYISNAPVAVGWNKDKFVYIINTPEHSANYYSDNGSAGNISPRDIGATCKNIFALKADNSLGNSEKFSTLMNEKGDVHFWMNTEQIQKATGAAAAMPMMNLQSLYEGSFTTATANFDNGKITIDAKSYAGKEMGDLWKKYNGNKIDEEMIKRIPAKDIAAVFALNFKPEGIKEFVKVLGIEAYVNLGLAFAGFTLDDFVKANKGDILIALTDIKTVTDSVPSFLEPNKKELSTKTEPEFLFAAAVGDKSSFNQLIKAGEKLGKDKGANLPVTYSMGEKYFAIGNSKENNDKYIAGGSNNNFDFIDKINGEPMGGYINFQYIFKAVANEVKKDSSSIAIFDASAKFWDNAFFKGGNYTDGGLTQKIEINLVDKNTNSLKQLNQYLGKVGQIMKEQEKQYRTRNVDVMADTTVVMPPVKKH